MVETRNEICGDVHAVHVVNGIKYSVTPQQRLVPVNTRLSSSLPAAPPQDNMAKTRTVAKGDTEIMRMRHKETQHALYLSKLSRLQSNLSSLFSSGTAASLEADCYSLYPVRVGVTLADPTYALAVCEGAQRRADKKTRLVKQMARDMGPQALAMDPHSEDVKSHRAFYGDGSQTVMEFAAGRHGETQDGDMHDHAGDAEGQGRLPDDLSEMSSLVDEEMDDEEGDMEGDMDDHAALHDEDEGDMEGDMHDDMHEDDLDAEDDEADHEDEE